MDSPDPFNHDLAKDLSGADVPHRFQLSAEYRLPKFQSGLLGQRVVSAIVSDWGMGWFVEYQSGALLGRPASAGTDPISNWLGYGPGAAQLKRDADGRYMNPWSVDWNDLDGNHHTEPLDINCHCFDPRKTLVLNRNAWENVPNGQWADDMSSLRFYRGLRYPNENLNISRIFRFKERFVLMVRAEWQNVFNRTRLPQPATSGFTSNPTQSGGVYTGGFGTINPLAGNGLSGMRSGTLIGRLTF
jgi:hypothetical protein